MQSRHILVVEQDPAIREHLLTVLRRHFVRVSAATTMQEAKSLLPTQRIALAVVDLETVKLDEVARMRNDYGCEIVCTHHLPNEAMWAAALAAGALDCCYNDDPTAIVAAAQGRHHHAAA